jgi:dienelactone hydrolase
MKKITLAGLVLAGSMAAWADGPADNIAEKARPIPPPGIAVSEGDRVELQTGLDALAREIHALRAAPTKRADLLPDVEILHKAVRYALEGGEFFKTNEVRSAKDLLKLGMERAAQLKSGTAPWLTSTGLVVRGYRSRVDGSVQPCGLVVPPAPAGGAPYRLDIWFHGRGETLSEVNFLAGRLRDPGQFTPPGALVLHVYNRYCNAARLAGETDVFEAMDLVKRTYRTDPNRVVVRGFSMGGASCWAFATHHAWMWAAAAPGAGFSETADFLKVFQDETLRPTPWEQKLWRLYDATEYAANIFNVPLVAYSGEIDRQKQAADMMEKAMAAEGLTLTHIIGPATAHKYEPGAKAKVEALVDAAAARGRDPLPAKVRFTTFTLRYNRMAWVVVDAMEQHWERARVEAELDADEETIRATTKGVTALSFVFDQGPVPFGGKAPIAIVLDGQMLAPPRAFTDTRAAHFRKAGAEWEAVAEVDRASLAKRHGLQGPIDDAFMDSFLFVRPTGPAMSTSTAAWVSGEMNRAVREWRRQFRGDVRVKEDAAVTDADIAAHNLVLWGDPRSNALLARIAERLPVRWDATAVALGGRTWPAAHHVPVMIFPNPLNPKRYVVLNSGFTWREYDYLNNARQTPKLPDWAVVDIRSPATSRAPGAIAAAGFFGERWEVK